MLRDRERFFWNGKAVLYRERYWELKRIIEQRYANNTCLQIIVLLNEDFLTGSNDIKKDRDKTRQ